MQLNRYFSLIPTVTQVSHALFHDFKRHAFLENETVIMAFGITVNKQIILVRDFKLFSYLVGNQTVHVLLFLGNFDILGVEVADTLAVSGNTCAEYLSDWSVVVRV